MFRWFTGDYDKDASDSSHGNGVKSGKPELSGFSDSIKKIVPLFLYRNNGKPRFFDQIDVPDYWEISGSNVGGEIRDLNRLRGRIFFNGGEDRLVSEVDWLDEKGNARCTDHYDNHGFLYSRTVFNKDGQRFCHS